MVGLIGLLVCEQRGLARTALAFKTVASVSFVVVAAMQSCSKSVYHQAILTGLALSLVGDVLLALPGERFFLAGLVSFLLGHVAFVVAFFWLGSLGPMMFAGLGLGLIIGIRVFQWLAPNLGDMKKPVIAYMAVITVMVSGALAVAEVGTIPTLGRFLVLAGALSFYVSDVTVAKDRFVDGLFVNRLVGLPLYYIGQFMFAFSIGHLG